MKQYIANETYALNQDSQDALAKFRESFLFPPAPNGSGKPSLYFAGNSLGLQPKKAQQYINEALADWAHFGVEGHVHGDHPWLPYHEFVTEPMARIMGAQPNEVVVMNTLTVNLHLMMVSFYRPTQERFKILIEGGAFPSDQYAVASQAKFHGFDPQDAIIELKPRPGEATLRTEDILSVIEREGDQISLIMLGNVNYLTGQAYDIPTITQAGHSRGCQVGFDLAHGAGNLLLKLHDWNVDFAVWCSYKYLNSGPGSLSGCFVHERHVTNKTLPRFAGWWGHDKKTRFEMPSQFNPITTAEGWQLSNPPIFQLAGMRASLELFDAATMPALRKKSEALTGYLEFLLSELPAGFCTQVTPRDPAQRGTQLSLRIQHDPKGLVKELSSSGVIADFREPNIVRFAPAPLYCSFLDVYQLVEVLKRHANQ
jgi:kynureninase